MIRLITTCLLVLALALPAVADDDGDAPAAGAAATTTASPRPAFTPEQQRQMMRDGMARYEANRAVTATHARLAALAGSWDMAYRVSMGPGSPQWASFDGVATFEPVLGGRYLLQRTRSTSPMGTTEGLGLLGYDNRRERYESVWLDEASTSMNFSVTEDGTDPDAPASRTGRFYDPYLDQESATRETLTFRDDGTLFLAVEVHQPLDGSWWRFLEITYTRPAAARAADPDPEAVAPDDAE